MRIKKWISFIAASALLLCAFAAFGGCGKKDGKETTLGYPPKAPITARTFDVIDISQMSTAESLTIACLQGILARKSENQIYITNNLSADANGVHTYASYQLYLDELVKNYNVTYTLASDPWALIAKNLEYVNGYIVCDLHQPSENVATSYAGVRDALVIDRSLKKQAEDLGIEMIMDVCGLTESVFTKEIIEREGFSKEIAVELPPVIQAHVRDYAVMTKSLVFYVGIDSRRDDMMQKLNLVNDGIIMGWGDASSAENETPFIKGTSAAGYHFLVADLAYNYAALSGFKSRYEKYEQNIERTVEKEENVHYVCFVISDGSNLRWVTNERYSSTEWWQDPARGDYKVSWTNSPSLLDLAPVSMDLYYASSSRNDEHIPEGGEGFILPESKPEKSLAMHGQRLSEYMARMDTNVASVISKSGFVTLQDSIWNNFLKHDNIHGLLYFEWDLALDNMKGAIKFVNGKPIISCSKIYAPNWGNHTTTADSLVARVNDPAKRDITKSDAYTVVWVNAWRSQKENEKIDLMSDLKAVTARFGSDVRVVNAHQMIDAVSKNVTR